ncbi:MAG: lysophospholipid acyltransferase family protein [Steroidobacteraceae bacterium]|nr:lysophospholipid acyltransferase family protein [Nevskiaceae bacterium]MCP5338999.1 lysophospholipid acyltransferase family protein [Nevskiaceae bacterium]MCP5359589.1 lysophospholipid acyltransferase family protein [Nevskiaceae bacterium]MCP5472618.1 lysophospholipid acyltransferase family protein [Nevskiaceae bacterium]
MTESGPDGGHRETSRDAAYQQLTRSGRRMSIGRRLAYACLVPLLLGVLRLLWATCRRPQVIGAEHLQAALERAPSLIPCYWHQHQLFCARYLLERRDLGLRAGFLISPSVDGEIGARLVHRLGGEVIRGSSTYTGARALRDFYEALVRRDISPAITPDGPRGPAFEFKPGAILLAQMSGRPMLPLAFAASRSIRFHWDRFVLPLPGARIVIAVGEPRWVPKRLDAAALAGEQSEMARRLRATFELAHAQLKAVRK